MSQNSRTEPIISTTQTEHATSGANPQLNSIPD